jgi:hypothetical protein
MNLKEAIKILEDYNKWRLGSKLDQPNPKEVTEALEIAINIMDQLT